MRIENVQWNKEKELLYIAMLLGLFLFFFLLRRSKLKNENWIFMRENREHTHLAIFCIYMRFFRSRSRGKSKATKIIRKHIRLALSLSLSPSFLHRCHFSKKEKYFKALKIHCICTPYLKWLCYILVWLCIFIHLPSCNCITDMKKIEKHTAY